MLGPLLLTLAVLASGEPPQPAPIPSFGWLGLQTFGPGPPGLERALAVHLSIALRGIGLALADPAQSLAQGSAACRISEVGWARCGVLVQRSDGSAHAKRDARIPFHDAEDLSESLAMLVADALVVDLHAGHRLALPSATALQAPVGVPGATGPAPIVAPAPPAQPVKPRPSVELELGVTSALPSPFPTFGGTAGAVYHVRALELGGAVELLSGKVPGGPVFLEGRIGPVLGVLLGSGRLHVEGRLIPGFDLAGLAATGTRAVPAPVLAASAGVVYAYSSHLSIDVGLQVVLRAHPAVLAIQASQLDLRQVIFEPTLRVRYDL